MTGAIQIVGQTAPAMNRKNAQRTTLNAQGTSLKIESCALKVER
jgi:hypothetical protein